MRAGTQEPSQARTAASGSSGRSSDPGCRNCPPTTPSTHFVVLELSACATPTRPQAAMTPSTHRRRSGAAPVAWWHERRARPCGRTRPDARPWGRVMSDRFQPDESLLRRPLHPWPIALPSAGHPGALERSARSRRRSSRRRPAGGSAHRASEGQPDGSLVSSVGSSLATSRRTTTRRSLARRRGGRAQRPARAADRVPVVCCTSGSPCATPALTPYVGPGALTLSFPRALGRHGCSWTRPGGTFGSARRQRHAFTFGATRCARADEAAPSADVDACLLAAVRPVLRVRARTRALDHVAWSGNHRVSAERTVTVDAVLAGGELLAAWRGRACSPARRSPHPRFIGSWGDGSTSWRTGFPHDEWRQRPAHPRRPRPVTLNTWEAVLLRPGPSRGLRCAGRPWTRRSEPSGSSWTTGWFTGRRDDTAGLGDWYVGRDRVARRPPSARRPRPVRSAWISACGSSPRWSTRTVNLARRHPDWILRGPHGPRPPPARHQQVLDLAHPEAYAHIAGRFARPPGRVPDRLP